MPRKRKTGKKQGRPMYLGSTIVHTMRRMTIEQYCRIILLIIVTIYFFIVYDALYIRYLFFEMREPTDSAAYMQATWSIINGTPFTITTQEDFIRCFPHNLLGDQLFLTLPLFSPFLLILSSGETFLAIQTFIISIGSIILYSFAYKKLKKPFISLFIAICYLVNPMTFLSFKDFGFRPETIFIPCIYALFLFLLEKKYMLATISLILCILTKHNAIAISFMIGIYLLLFDRKLWRFGLFSLMLSFIYYIIGVKIIMASFQENPVAHFKHFAQFGSTPMEALVNIFFNPKKIFALLSKNEFFFMKDIFSFIGIFALINPVFWICLSELIINIVLTDYHSIFCAWHWTLVLPFLFIGIVSTIFYIFKVIKSKIIVKCVSIMIVLLMLLNIIHHSVLFHSMVVEESNDFKKKEIDPYKIINRLSIIEPNASVMVTGQLLWFFFNRNRVYVSRINFHDDVDYIVMLLPIGLYYINIDKYIIKYLQNRDDFSSKFHNFYEIYNDQHLIILKHI